MSQHPPPHVITPSRHTLLIALIIAASGLLVGLDTGLIAEALTFIGDTFHMSIRTQEWTVSILMIGAGAGSWFAGGLSQKLGRRHALLGAMLLMLAGAALCVTATSIPQIMLGRLFIGGAIGICTFTAPLYISELTTGPMRARMVSTYSMLQSAGILLGYIIGSALATGAHWRWMVGFPILPAALLFACSRILPGTPAWLVTRGRREDARAILHSLRDDPAEADHELARIESEIRLGSTGGLTLLRTNRAFRRVVALGIALQIMQQFTGINIVMYYAPRIFQNASFPPEIAAWTTSFIGFINLLVGMTAIYAVGRWGRRPLLVTSCAIMALAMLAAALLEASPSTTTTSIGLVTSLLIFVAGFGLAAGPLVWTLCSEIQPTDGREFGVACSTLANWTADWLVSNSCLSIMALIGTAWTFGTLMLTNLAFIALTLAFVPETRDVPLEDIEARLEAGNPLRKIGR